MSDLVFFIFGMVQVTDLLEALRRAFNRDRRSADESLCIHRDRVDIDARNSSPSMLITEPFQGQRGSWGDEATAKVDSTHIRPLQIMSDPIVPFFEVVRVKGLLDFCLPLTHFLLLFLVQSQLGPVNA
jgi:hypothetical protein